MIFIKEKGIDKKEYVLPLGREDDPGNRLKGHLKEGMRKVVLEPEDRTGHCIGRCNGHSKFSRFVPVTGQDFTRSHRGLIREDTADKGGTAIFALCLQK